MKIDYKDNFCVDQPDPRDYPAGEYVEMAMGLDLLQRPKEKVQVWNQGKEGACTRYGITHISNGQNILEYIKNNGEYTQLNPADVWARSNKNLTLQSALNQLKTEGLIQGWTAIPRYPKDKSKAIITMKQAIDMGNYIFTGSDNGDRGRTKLPPYIYQVRTDGKIVGHAFCIVAYDDNAQLFRALNSRGSGRGDAGYFYLRYEDIDKLFTKYCIIDKDDSGKFAKFKRLQRARQLVSDISSFRHGELDIGIQDLLHSTAERIRSKYSFM